MASKPGEKALEAIKKLNSEVSLFKVPKVPQTKKPKMKLLTEEQYVEEIGKIIQKDFFPDLEKLKAQNSYLEAVERNDVIKLRELYAKYSGKTPEKRVGAESPATFETPLLNGSETPMSCSSRASNASKSSRKRDKSISDGHTLDSFMSTYTSEDNQSFEELIEAADAKLQQRFAALYDAEKSTALAIENSLKLPSIEQQFEVIEGTKNIDSWTYTNKNYIMYVPDGVELTREEQMEMAKQKQEIDHSNTRLKHNPFDDQTSKNTIHDLAKSHAQGLSGKIDVDGKIFKNLAATPNIRGFSFVKTPSPHPGVAESPLMTWGELDGTPFRLDGGETPIRPSGTASFRIAETSKRETIALQLAEKVSERMREKKAKAIEMARRNIASPRIRSTLDRLASMSPAAKRLASSRREALLTPSPMSIRSTGKSHTPVIVRRKTPSLRSKTPVLPRQTKTILTDDLLKIPTKAKDRPKASDYF